MPSSFDENLLTGFEHADDAGVFKVDSSTALVQTLDFLTPVVNDPYMFGQIAAANSLSDVYAMGGKPLTAMNIVCFPVADYSIDILKKTLLGGYEKIKEAGASLVGGHSVDDSEFKYGLSVTGIVHPDKALYNSSVRLHDKLVLTKPIGTGILSTAIKGGLVSAGAEEQLGCIMSSLNKNASEIMRKYNSGGCTDVTGFGLAGHLVEMAKASSKRFVVYSEYIPIIKDAKTYAEMGIIPEGTYKNRDYFKDYISMHSSISSSIKDLLFDPQTSGGLIISVTPEDVDYFIEDLKNSGIDAEIFGECVDDHDNGLIEIC